MNKKAASAILNIVQAFLPDVIGLFVPDLVGNLILVPKERAFHDRKLHEMSLHCNSFSGYSLTSAQEYRASLIADISLSTMSLLG